MFLSKVAEVMPEWRKLTIEVDATQNRVSQGVEVRFLSPAQLTKSPAIWGFCFVLKCLYRF